MKEWSVVKAEGSLMELTKRLNELEAKGYSIHQVLPPISMPSPDGRVHLKTTYWPIVAFTERWI